jgi:two-component system NtrC family sensor kinase
MENKADLTFAIQDFHQLMTHTKDGAERIKRIVEQLRGFSHLSGSDFSAANINEALEDTLTMVWNELKYKATIKKNYGELPPVNCMIGEIKQVFVNLLVNAAHAIPNSGEIILTTLRDSEDIVIKISDTGCGIPQKNINRIFDPFFTTKEVGKGTGLGLWISATIINKHKGTLTVESTVGVGTTFIIRLPIDQEEERNIHEH